MGEPSSLQTIVEVVEVVTQGRATALPLLHPHQSEHSFQGSDFAT